MLLPKDGIYLRGFEAEIIKQLKPKALQPRRVGFKEIKVVPNSRQNIVKLDFLVLVLPLDLCQDRPLNTFVCLHILYTLVRDELTQVTFELTWLLQQAFL